MLPRHFFSILCAAYIFSGVTNIFAQQRPPFDPKIFETERRGEILLLQKDYKGAAEAFRDAIKQRRDHPANWYFLGVALAKAGELDEARKAFKESLRLDAVSFSAASGLAYTSLLAGKYKDAEKEGRYALGNQAEGADAHYIFGSIYLYNDDPAKALEETEASLKSNGDFAPSLFLRARALLYLVAQEPPKAIGEPQQLQRLREAASSLETCLTKSTTAEDLNFWREQLSALRAHIGILEQKSIESNVFLSSETTSKAVILDRPEPLYSTAARAGNVRGGVLLRMVLASDRTVRHILALKTLPFGLTAQAVAAARLIRFTPATKEQRPVSQFMTIEYNFNIY
jgi:tetratricopeptide (TPR) repeat protein